MENGKGSEYFPNAMYWDSEAKTFNLALYSRILDLRSNVSYEVTVQNVTFYFRVFS